MTIHKTTSQLLKVIARKTPSSGYLDQLIKAIADYREAGCPDADREIMKDHDVFKNASGGYATRFCYAFGEADHGDPCFVSERHWQMQVLEASKVFQDKCASLENEVSLELFDGQYAVYIDPLLDGTDG